MIKFFVQQQRESVRMFERRVNMFVEKELPKIHYTAMCYGFEAVRGRLVLMLECVPKPPVPQEATA